MEMRLNKILFICLFFLSSCKGDAQKNKNIKNDDKLIEKNIIFSTKCLKLHIQ